MVVFLAACTKGALTAVAATAAAPTPAFLRKSRLFIVSGSFHGFRVNIQPNFQFNRHKAIDVYTAIQKKIKSPIGLPVWQWHTLNWFMNLCGKPNTP
jgi:hypothetical protein